MKKEDGGSLAVGLSFGVLYGLLFDNLALGLAIGVALGASGAFVSRKKKQNNGLTVYVFIGRSEHPPLYF